ncbi:MAG TPA: C39 family peptidase [Chloroflexota bacterium]|nr:C39 family peptidase [Chloroflexota bacterium]
MGTRAGGAPRGPRWLLGAIVGGAALLVGGVAGTAAALRHEATPAAPLLTHPVLLAAQEPPGLVAEEREPAPPIGELAGAALESEEAPGAALTEAGAEVSRLLPRPSIPFRTQRDGSRWAGSNCGPAALGMILEARGIAVANDDLRFQTHTYQGTVGMRTGTALQHIARVAEDYGVPTRGLYDADGFHRWTIDELRAEVAQGNPVVALVKYRLLPGREGAAVRFDHYIVLWDLTPDGFVYNDPAYPTAEEGFARTLTNAQLDAAMQPTLVPRQAVAFVFAE